MAAKKYVGLMTGTSLDGIDIASATFEETDSGVKMGIEDFTEAPFDPDIKELILKTINETVTIAEVSRLHFALAKQYAKITRKFCEENDEGLTDVEAVGIHGQTVWHEPRPEKIGEFETASTLQLGSGPALAAELGVPVVSDFRASDVALGGQGAPLVTAFDYEFLRKDDKPVVALNVGGISNITYLPAGGKKEESLAFDCGPGNVLIDVFVKEYFDKSYDCNGDLARSGSFIQDFFDELASDPFITRKPPKSTGREHYNKEYLNAVLRRKNIEDFRKRDLLHTLTRFSAWAIAENVKNFADETSEIVVSGGGCKNSFLTESLKGYLPKADIVMSDERGIPSDAKEALCFAYLAFLRTNKKTGNVVSATGAERTTVLGSVSLG